MDHQTGLEVLQDFREANDHLKITELQRLEWIDYSIDQADRNLDFIRSLWKRYLERLDSLVWHYHCPDPRICSDLLRVILTSYVNHLRLGSSDPEAVFNYISQLLFLGISSQVGSQDNNTFFLLLAEYYCWHRLKYQPDLSIATKMVESAISKRNHKYMDYILQDREVDRSVMYLDDDISYLDDYPNNLLIIYNKQLHVGYSKLVI